jgi:signal transduction histidine kinase
MQEILSQIIKAAVELADAEWGFVVWEPKEGTAVRACAGLSLDDIGDSDLELALSAKEPQTGQATESRSYIVLPLWSSEEAAFALYVARTHQEAFSDSDLELLQAFADGATVAIQNAYVSREVASAEADFVEMIAHDLRHSTISVQAYSDLMLRGIAGPLNEHQERFLSIIHNNACSIDAIARDFSDIAKLNHKRMSLTLALISLEASTNAVAEKLSSMMEDRELTLQVDLADLPNATADKMRLEQVVRILLENAYRYTPAGGKITVTGEAQDGFVRLAVTNTGISPEEKASLSTKCYMIADSAAQERVGKSSNLYVARRLVEMMGGQIGAEGDPGQGTTLFFTLPVATESTDEA